MKFSNNTLYSYKNSFETMFNAGFPSCKLKSLLIWWTERFKVIQNWFLSIKWPIFNASAFKMKIMIICGTLYHILRCIFWNTKDLASWNLFAVKFAKCAIYTFSLICHGWTVFCFHICPPYIGYLLTFSVNIRSLQFWCSEPVQSLNAFSSKHGSPSLIDVCRHTS